MCRLPTSRAFRAHQVQSSTEARSPSAGSGCSMGRSALQPGGVAQRGVYGLMLMGHWVKSSIHNLKVIQLVSITGWWFGTFFIFQNIWDVILPIDFHIFQDG